MNLTETDNRPTHTPPQSPHTTSPQAPHYSQHYTDKVPNAVPEKKLFFFCKSSFVDLYNKTFPVSRLCATEGKFSFLDEEGIGAQLSVLLDNFLVFRFKGGGGVGGLNFY